MTCSALRTPLIPLFSALLLASPAAARHPRHDAAEDDSCERLAPGDEVLDQALRSGALDRDQRFASVRLSGPASIPEDALWDLAGGKPSRPLSRDEAIALVARLAQAGVFSAIAPAVRALPGEQAELDLALTANPQVRSVQVRGLSEFRTEDVLERILEAPSGREVETRRREVRAARAIECPAPLPPREWLARVEDGEVRPGVLWRGLRPALRRVLLYLRARGYPLARLDGELTQAGELRLEVDEGHLGGVEVRGVDARIARSVRTELGILPGDVFTSGDLYIALDRIQRRWPFLRPDRRSRRSSSSPALQLEDLPDGGVSFRSERKLESSPRRDGDDEEDDDGFDDDAPSGRQRHRWPPFLRAFLAQGSWYGFDGDTLVVHLRSERSRLKLHPEEILRHTPVTGFAPGLAGTLTLFDPADRTHLLFDGAVNINTRRPSRDAAAGTYLERLNAQERVDWLAGLRLRVPALSVAELGGQIHTLTDTADGWRMAPFDSYLYSALLNRADREYYRRSGFAGFLTLHLLETLTLGAEYRRDRYAPLATPSGVWSVFNSGEVLYGAAPVEEGEMGSVVFRLEVHSEKVPLQRVGSMWRNSETSLVPAEPGTLGLRSVNTVEVADRSLGGTFDFTRVVSDDALTVETGRWDRLTLRVRGAGGHDLPLQKQEGLGGWTALRGYDFKEFRGDASVLGTLQFDGRHFGAFLDVGTVHQGAAGWLDLKPSAGAVFWFGDGSTRAEAAWRLDGHARLAPEFRILFSVPL